MPEDPERSLCTHGRSAGLIARTLEEMQERGEAIDWRERGNPERQRS